MPSRLAAAQLAARLEEIISWGEIRPGLNAELSLSRAGRSSPSSRSRPDRARQEAETVPNGISMQAAGIEESRSPEFLRQLQEQGEGFDEAQLRFALFV